MANLDLGRAINTADEITHNVLTDEVEDTSRRLALEAYEALIKVCNLEEQLMKEDPEFNESNKYWFDYFYKLSTLFMDYHNGRITKDDIRKGMTR